MSEYLLVLGYCPVRKEFTEISWSEKIEISDIVVFVCFVISYFRKKDGIYYAVLLRQAFLVTSNFVFHVCVLPGVCTLV